MQVFLIVAPVFAIIALGYAAAKFRLLSEVAHKGIAEFAFSIAIPALLLRTIAVAEMPAVNPFALWGTYFGAVAATWILATLATAFVLRRPATDGPSIAIGSTYGNVVMIGIPLCLAALGDAATAPMALILTVHTAFLWIVGTLHMEWVQREAGTTISSLLVSLAKDLARNPLIIAIATGTLWRLTGIGLHPVVDRTLYLLAQSGVPCALIALGASLVNFRIKGQAPTLAALCVLKLVFMPAVAWVLAFHVFKLPFVPAAVVVLFAAMPAGANVYIFAMRYQKVVNSASGAVALGTVLSAGVAAALITALIE